jgi:energy-coupling factor transporter ATP-binding protein EcfA2
VYIERLVLSEFRAIARSDIEFTHPMAPRAASLELPNINLLVGTNGGGKSTILKAIAAALLGDRVDLIDMTAGSVLTWPRLGATGPSYARVTSTATSDRPGPSSTSLRETWVEIDSSGVRHSGDEELGTGRSTVSLFGYGPQRLASRDLAPDHGDGPADRVANLFEWRQELRAPESWITDVDADTLSAVNFLMPPETTLTGGMAGDEVEVESRGLAVARSMLSDGAQSYMAWMLDLVFRLIESGGVGGFRDVRAAVLIDEVDQRMHPRWQQSVLRTLSDGLPNIQFICSAHSPLLAGGLRPENLTVLEPDFNAPGEGAMKASHLEEDLYGRTADGVLTSSYFNLPSSRSDDFRQQLRRLADAAATMDQEAIDFVRMLTAGSDDSDIRVRSELIERPDRLRRRR